MGLRWVRPDEEVIKKEWATPDFSLKPKSLRSAIAAARMDVMLSRLASQTSTRVISAKLAMEVLPVLLAALEELLPEEES